MNPVQTENEIIVAHEESVMEDALKTFWDKAKAASQLILQLRKDNRLQNDRIAHLEMEIMSLRADILTKDQELKRLHAQHTQMINSNGHEFFSEEERESLKLKIRDLIAKINSHI